QGDESALIGFDSSRLQEDSCSLGHSSMPPSPTRIRLTLARSSLSPPSSPPEKIVDPPPPTTCFDVVVDSCHPVV
ncbi:hypothetical protein Dimus_030319, partial [Dionaea muscipula]